MDMLINKIIGRKSIKKNSLKINYNTTREYSDIGLVTYKMSKKAKNVKLSINLKGEVKLIIPCRISIKKAEEFLFSKSDWVLRQKELMKNKLGAKLDLIKNIHETSESGEGTNDVESDKALAFAKVSLINRTRYLAETHNFSINKITIRKQKTLWGSCSGGNNISLNINLAKLPKEIMDYVIIHELVHTIHKNHSSKFWSCVAEYMPEYKMRDKNLKKYSILLLQ